MAKKKKKKEELRFGEGFRGRSIRDEDKKEEKPEKKKETKTKQKPAPSQPQIIRDQETGKVTGIRRPDGSTTFADYETVKAIAEKYAAEPTPEGAVEAEELQAQREEQQRQQEILPVAEEAGVFKGPPERRELDVEEGQAGLISKIPVIGTMSEVIGESILRMTGKTQEDEPLIKNPEGQRQIMLQEIQKEELKKAQSFEETLGVAAEAVGLNKLPFGIGDVAEKFIKTPSEDVETLRNEIKEVQGRVSGMTDAASQGEIGNPAEVLRQLDRYDKQLAEIEAQLKYLFLLSSEIKSNPEEVNLIEEEILSAREDIFESKQRAAEGALITPSTESLYYKLRELKNE